jgi:Beta-Casp domain
LRRPTVKSRTPLPPLLVTQAERNLTDTVLSVLRREGNVLLPVDASGRVLELALLLDRAWERQRLTQTYNLVWVAPMVANTAAFAKCQLEWMARQLTEQFDSTSGNPFQLRNMHLCSSVREFEQFIEEKQNPTCVLASGLCLEGGPARDILLMWANNPDHAVIFTDSSQCYLRKQASSVVQTDAAASHAVKTETESILERRNVKPVTPDGLIVAENGVSEWTTAAQLLSTWFQAKIDDREMDDSVRVDVNVPVRSPLVGAELVEFLAREDEKRRELARNEEKVAMLREVEIAKGQLRLEEKEVGGGASHAADRSSETASSAFGVSQPKKKKRFDSLLFLKYSKPQHRK